MALATCTCTLTCYDAEGAAEVGVDFSVKVIEGDGTEGYSISTATKTETTDAQGLVSFTLIRGKRYKIWREADRKNAVPFTVPDAATFDIPEVLGSP